MQKLFAMIENFSIFDSEISVLLFYAKAGDLKKSTRFQTVTCLKNKSCKFLILNK